MGLLCLRTLLLLVCRPVVVEANSVVELVTKVKTFHGASVETFEILAKELKTLCEADTAKKVEKWNNDWLSIMGVNRGITGLVKDFALNYLGRNSYHNVNGPLIDSLKKVASAVPDEWDEDGVEDLLYYLRKVCKEGKILFQSGGSLYEMLDELQSLLDTKGIEKTLITALKSNTV